MKVKMFALGIVVMLIATMAGCIGDEGVGGGLGDYNVSNTLTNIIDSTFMENVIIEIPLKVTIDIDAKKQWDKDKEQQTTMANYKYNNYTATYTASVVPLDASSTMDDSDYAPVPSYASDSTILGMAQTFMPQRLRIGEENYGEGTLYSGDNPIDLEKIASSVEGFGAWEDIFGGGDRMFSYDSLDTIINTNKLSRAAGEGGVKYKLDTMTFNLQGQKLAATKMVHIMELPVNIKTDLKDLNDTLLDRPQMLNCIFIPVPGVGIYARTGNDISDTYEFYPTIKYLAPLGIIDKGFLNIEVEGSEAVADDWVFYVKKEEIGLVENWVRVGHKFIGDFTAAITFGAVDVASNLKHDGDRPVSRSKMTRDYLQEVGIDGQGRPIFEHITEIVRGASFVEEVEGKGLRNFNYELIPGGDSIKPGLLGTPGFESGSLIAGMMLAVIYITVSKKRRQSK